jgi:hypothetical protein
MPIKTPQRVPNKIKGQEAPKIAQLSADKLLATKAPMKPWAREKVQTGTLGARPRTAMRTAAPMGPRKAPAGHSIKLRRAVMAADKATRAPHQTTATFKAPP